MVITSKCLERASTEKSETLLDNIATGAYNPEPQGDNMSETANGSVFQALLDVQNLLEEMQSDASKCDLGNKAAGTRIRKDVQEAMKVLKSVRVLVLEKRQA